MNVVTVTRRTPNGKINKLYEVLEVRKSATVTKGVTLRRVAQDTESGIIQAVVGVSCGSCIRKVEFLSKKPSKASQNLKTHIEHAWVNL